MRRLIGIVAGGLFAIAVTLGPSVVPERVITTADLFWSVLTGFVVCLVLLAVTHERVWPRWSFALQLPLRRTKQPWTLAALARSDVPSPPQASSRPDPMAPMRRALDEAHREAARASEPVALRLVSGEVIEARTVILDGTRYSQCVFRNVTFRWLGGPWQIDSGNRLEGSINYETLSADAVNALDQLKALNLLGNPDFGRSWGPRAITVTQVVEDPLEVLFRLDDPIYSAINPLEQGQPHQHRLGIRSRGGRSVRRVRVAVMGVDAWINGLWQGVPSQVAASITTRAAFLREMNDRPPFQKSREGVTIDPATNPTLFVIAERRPREDRFDVPNTLANDNFPLNPDMPFRLRLEVMAEDLAPAPVAVKLWASADGQLMCKLLTTVDE